MSMLEHQVPDKSTSFRKRASRVLSLFPSDKKNDSSPKGKNNGLRISQPVDSSWPVSAAFDDRRVPLSPSTPQRNRNPASQTYPKSILKRSSYVPTREPPIPARNARHTLSAALPLSPSQKFRSSPKREPAVQNSVEYLHSPSESPVITRFPTELVTEKKRTVPKTAVEAGSHYPHTPCDNANDSFSLVSDYQPAVPSISSLQSTLSSENSDATSNIKDEGARLVDKVDTKVDFPTEFSPPEQMSPLNLNSDQAVQQDFINQEANALSAKYANLNRDPSPSKEEKDIELLEAWENNCDRETCLFCCIGPEHRGIHADAPLTRAKANRQSAIIGDDIISLRSAGEDSQKPPNFSRKQSTDAPTTNSPHTPLIFRDDTYPEIQHPKYATAVTTPEVCKVLCAKPAEDSPALSCSLNRKNDAWYVRQKFTTAKAKITGRSCVSAYYANT